MGGILEFVCFNTANPQSFLAVNYKFDCTKPICTWIGVRQQNNSAFVSIVISAAITLLHVLESVCSRNRILLFVRVRMVYLQVNYPPNVLASVGSRSKLKSCDRAVKQSKPVYIKSYDNK